MFLILTVIDIVILVLVIYYVKVVLNNLLFLIQGPLIPIEIRIIFKLFFNIGALLSLIAIFFRLIIIGASLQNNFVLIAVLIHVLAVVWGLVAAFLFIFFLAGVEGGW